ncbi:MAG: hypothetical protein RIS01_354, partial [Actinomycetota bacterium]
PTPEGNLWALEMTQSGQSLAIRKADARAHIYT